MKKMGLDTVAAINETAFSRVLVSYLNDTVDLVVNYGEWPQLRIIQKYQLTSVENRYQCSVAGAHLRNIQGVRIVGRASELQAMHPIELENAAYASVTGIPWAYSVVDASADDPIIKVHPMEDTSILVTGFKVHPWLDVSAATSTGAVVLDWHAPLIVQGLHAQALYHEGGNTETPEFVTTFGLFMKNLQSEFAKYTTDTGRYLRLYAPRQ
jgi:hypothetical protein